MEQDVTPFWSFCLIVTISLRILNSSYKLTWSWNNKEKQLSSIEEMAHRKNSKKIFFKKKYFSWSHSMGSLICLSMIMNNLYVKKLF